MSSRRAKSSKKHKDDSQTSEDKLIVDPYEIIATPVCVCSLEEHSRKKNCAKNPWCVFGLGEKEGIWRNSNVAINSLGLDPNVYLRKRDSKQYKDEVLYPPAGLRNLGATCYLNVLIQSLFHNLLVQDAVFNMEVDKVKNGNGSSSTEIGASAATNEMVPVIRALQNSFAHMKLCHDGVVDLTQFVDLLGLNKSTQQDPQEFNKLFLAKIESASLSTMDSSRATFDELLSGRVKYLTKCRRCNTERAPPEHPFHELDLSVEGVRSVEEALEAYSAVEVMSGENQYECGTCKKRCDAERSTVILSAPAVLNLHLLRYGYDRETYERKKLTSEVAFSDVIKVCGEAFKLVSVLYHKGRSAYGGHYVCDGLDWHSGEWWHYDDDTVFATTNPAVSANTNTNTITSNTNNSTNTGRSTPMCIDLVDTPSSTPSKSPKASKPNTATKNSTNTNTKTSNAVKPVFSSIQPIRKRKGLLDEGALSDCGSEGESEEEVEEWQEAGKGKNKRTLATNKGRPGAAAAKKGPAQKRKRGGAGTEVQDLTAGERDLNTTENNSEGEAGSAGANKAVKLGFNRKRDAYMLTYVRLADYQHSLQAARIPPAAALRSVVSSASAEYDKKVEVYNTNKELLMLEIAQRKEVYNEIRSTMVPELTGEPKFTLVPVWWLNKYIKGDVSTLQYSGSSSSGGSSGGGTSSNACCIDIDANDTSNTNNTSSTTVVIDSDDEDITNTNNTTNNTAGNVVDDFEIIDTDNNNTAITTTNNTATANNTKCATINTTSYLCRHGTGLDTTHLERFKVLSPRACSTIFNSSWQSMNYAFDQSNYRCSDCFDSVVHQRRTVQSLYTQYDTLLSLIDDTNTTHYSADSGSDSSSRSVQFWLSKVWLTQLRKYRNTLHKAEPGKGKAAFAKIFTASNSAALHSESSTNSNTANNTNINTIDDSVPVQTLDPLVNTNLHCEHQQPVLNYSKRAIKVSQAAWTALLELYPQALTLLHGAVCCELCANALSDTMEVNRLNKESRQRELEIGVLSTLYKAKRICPTHFDDLLNTPPTTSTHTTHTAHTASANSNNSNIFNPITNPFPGLKTTTTTTNTNTGTTSNIRRPSTTQYAVVDGRWLGHWRKYINDAQFPQPPPLTNTALMCHCVVSGAGSGTSSRVTTPNRTHKSNNTTTTHSTHHCLLPPSLSGIAHGIPPNQHPVNDLLVYKFSESDVGAARPEADPECLILDTTNTNTTSYPRAEIITVEQWNALLLFHSPTQSHPTTISGRKVIDLEEDSDFSDGDSETVTYMEGVYTLLLQYDNKKQMWAYMPPVCELCVAVIEKNAEDSASVYANATFSVVYFRDEAEFRKLFSRPDTTANNSTTDLTTTDNTTSANLATTEEEPRRSRRSRGTKVTTSICVDSTDTLAIVRLKVYQAFSVDLPPSNQLLFDTRGQCMNGHSKTLEEFKVRIGDTMYVLEGSNPTDSADWEYIDFFHSAGSGRAPEKGFGGTLLQGGGPSIGGESGAGPTTALQDSDLALATLSSTLPTTTLRTSTLLAPPSPHRSSSGASHDSAYVLVDSPELTLRKHASPHNITHTKHSKHATRTTRSTAPLEVETEEVRYERELQATIALSQREDDDLQRALQLSEMEVVSEVVDEVVGGVVVHDEGTSNGGNIEAEKEVEVEGMEVEEEVHEGVEQTQCSDDEDCTEPQIVEAEAVVEPLLTAADGTEGEEQGGAIEQQDTQSTVLYHTPPSPPSTTHTHTHTTNATSHTPHTPHTSHTAHTATPSSPSRKRARHQQQQEKEEGEVTESTNLSESDSVVGSGAVSAVSGAGGGVMGATRRVVYSVSDAVSSVVLGIATNVVDAVQCVVGEGEGHSGEQQRVDVSQAVPESPVPTVVPAPVVPEPAVLPVVVPVKVVKAPMVAISAAELRRMLDAKNNNNNNTSTTSNTNSGTTSANNTTASSTTAQESAEV